MGNTIGQLAVLGLLTAREAAYIAKVADNQGLLSHPVSIDNVSVRTALQLLRKEIVALTIGRTLAAVQQYTIATQLLHKIIQADEMVQHVLDYPGVQHVERLVKTADGRSVFVMVPQNLTVAELEAGIGSKFVVVLPEVDYQVDQDAL